MGGILKEGFDNDLSGNIDHTKVSFYYTVTLTQVLDRLNAPSVIDYFCLDVEGMYDRVGSLRTMNALPLLSSALQRFLLQVRSFMRFATLHSIDTPSKS
jgi:hypothetical protein